MSVLNRAIRWIKNYPFDAIALVVVIIIIYIRLTK